MHLTTTEYNAPSTKEPSSTKSINLASIMINVWFNQVKMFPYKKKNGGLARPSQNEHEATIVQQIYVT
jgi:hypothetical protein